jgi:hypothetical protein
MKYTRVYIQRSFSIHGLASSFIKCYFPIPLSVFSLSVLLKFFISYNFLKLHMDLYSQF